MNIQEEPTQTSASKGLVTVYFRRDQLSAADRRDLDSYAELLRSYYGIPDGQPVFPARPRSRRTGQPSRRRPVAAGTNRADHPWRGTL